MSYSLHSNVQSLLNILIQPQKARLHIMFFAVRIVFLMVIFLLFISMSACTRKVADDEPPKLMNIRAHKGTPDEFLILRNTTLATDIDFATLPTPINENEKTEDKRPFEEAIVALGGRLDFFENSQTTREERAIVKYTSRFGVKEDVKTVLRLEDQEIRRNNKAKVLERVAKLNIYFKVYWEQTLDSYTENNRLQRLGIKTVNAPLQMIEQQ